MKVASLDNCTEPFKSDYCDLVISPELHKKILRSPAWHKRLESLTGHLWSIGLEPEGVEINDDGVLLPVYSVYYVPGRRKRAKKK